MDPLEIICEYYDPDTRTFDILLNHSRQVAAKALAVARQVRHLHPDRKFIEEAAMLHDIGIFLTHTPDLGCTGPHPYVCHGVLGRKLLEERGLPKHALVCERHVGGGIRAGEVSGRKLPLPVRDMVPVTLEEEIICFADKFHSKSAGRNGHHKSIMDIVKELAPYGQDKIDTFLGWVDRFS